jgi:hypothetical protein
MMDVRWTAGKTENDGQMEGLNAKTGTFIVSS